MTKMWIDQKGQFFYADVGLWRAVFLDQTEPEFPVRPVTPEEHNAVAERLDAR